MRKLSPERSKRTWAPKSPRLRSRSKSAKRSKLPLAKALVRNVSKIRLRGDAMKLRRNERCPIHSSFFCCGREQKKRSFVLPVQRVDDPLYPRGYRELRSP